MSLFGQNDRRLIFGVCVTVLATGCDNGAARRAAEEKTREKAQAQVRRIAEDLDKQTTETGVYVRVKEDEIKDKDPWGTQIKITYSQGGTTEIVSVRSAGADREFQTNDDVVAQGMATNLKGIGEGIKKNAEETAANVAKGSVKGAVKGLKESIKDSLPFKKDGNSEIESKDSPSDADKPSDTKSP